MSNKYSDSNRATYSPEDNKLRLYVGRVPRDEFLKLREEGWVTLHKQREAGGGDFAATWTPARRNTALEYAGIIEDEDMGPEERAADRAERFGGYRDKRTAEATGHADRYEAGPMVHGYQSAERGEQAAARHDRIADRAGDAWEKAEYWQRRTAGVIAHALYKSSPSVRMGRIKTLEAELRKIEASREQHRKQWEGWEKVLSMDGAGELIQLVDGYADTRNMNPAQSMAYWLANNGNRVSIEHPDGSEINENAKKIHGDYWHGFDAHDFLTKDSYGGGPFRRLTPAEYAALFLKKVCKPDDYNASWLNHLTLRLAYENQMLEAQGGRAAHVEMEPGGKLGGHLIVKVCKSPATGRVTSVFIKGEKVQGWQYMTKNVPGADYSLHQIETERLPANAYTPPTPESLAELAKLKAAAPKKEACPLINPTDADAERLQAMLNANTREDRESGSVKRMTQAQYSANSAGTYAPYKAVEFAGGGLVNRHHYMTDASDDFPMVCKVRMHNFNVIVITDKPQKSLPAALWIDPRPAVIAECVDNAELIRAALCAGWSSNWTPEQKAMIKKAVSVGLVFWASQSQFGVTPKGGTILPKHYAATV